VRLKRFLRKNKIVFETLAAVLLSFMALLVSVMQLVVGTSQTRLLGLQTEIARVQAIPQFVAAINPIWDPKVEKFTAEELVVINRGALAREAEVGEAVFLDFTLTRKLEAGQIKKTLPLRDYFTATAVSSFGVEVGEPLTIFMTL
jgi:hypothetical protein